MAELLERLGPSLAGLVLIAVAGASRTAALAPMALLEPARKGGPAYAGMKPGGQALFVAAALSALLCLAPVLAGVPASRMGLAAAVMTGGALVMTEIARRQIKGHTGDVGGASQQIGEILFLCVLASRTAL
jgi:adenosylcobinamide-GDP ribazoletransferase